ncbi:hypothetical protein WJX79_009968 [Trebouxia sp. C0005]
MRDKPHGHDSHLCLCSGQARSRLRASRIASTSNKSLHVVVNEKKSLPVVIETKNVPVLLYAQKEEVEKDAIQQLVHLAESALPAGYVSAMPDVHLGKGVTIGTVFASENYICPNAVGVDIGCGMCAVPVDGLHKEDMTHEQLLKIQSLLKRRIPTGFNAHDSPLPSARMVLDEMSQQNAPSRWLEEASSQPKPAQQLGTLGGGNHFLEVVHDESGRVWLMLHSGSRNIGNITAQNYDKIAQAQLTQQNIKVPGGLNYLEIDSRPGQEYLQDVAWCQAYAFQNRKHMLDLMVDSVNEVTGALPDLEHSVNIHHNYCQCERCEYTDPRSGEKVDKQLWVTRKGATSAQKGQYGIIPGSMGVGSFITKGKGDPQAWNSSSHGAGRAMSRTRAKATITQKQFTDSMAIGRAVAIGLGTTFAVVQLLAYGGFVTVQWSKIHEDILRMCDVDGDGQFGATDMHSAIGSLLAMLSQGLPSVSGFCLGFGLGLRF